MAATQKPQDVRSERNKTQHLAPQGRSRLAHRAPPGTAQTAAYPKLTTENLRSSPSLADRAGLVGLEVEGLVAPPFLGLVACPRGPLGSPPPPVILANGPMAMLDIHPGLEGALLGRPFEGLVAAALAPAVAGGFRSLRRAVQAALSEPLFVGLVASGLGLVDKGDRLSFRRLALRRLDFCTTGPGEYRLPADGGGGTGGDPCGTRCRSRHNNNRRARRSCMWIAV